MNGTKLAPTVGVLTLAGLLASTAVAQQPQSQPSSPPAQQQPSAPQQPAMSSPPASPAAGEQRGGGQGTITVASDSLVGTKVRDPQGKDLGEVTKLLIDPKDGRVTSVLIKRGGTLGMGGTELSVPWNALRLQRGQHQELVVTMQQPMLEPTPQAQQEEQRQQERQQRQNQQREAPAASPGTSGQPQGGQQRQQ